MKKYILIILIVILLGSLFGCNSYNKSNSINVLTQNNFNDNNDDIFNECLITEMCKTIECYNTRIIYFGFIDYHLENVYYREKTYHTVDKDIVKKCNRQIYGEPYNGK